MPGRALQIEKREASRQFVGSQGLRVAEPEPLQFLQCLNRGHPGTFAPRVQADQQPLQIGPKVDDPEAMPPCSVQRFLSLPPILLDAIFIQQNEPVGKLPPR